MQKEFTKPMYLLNSWIPQTLRKIHAHNPKLFALRLYYTDFVAHLLSKWSSVQANGKVFLHYSKAKTPDDKTSGWDERPQKWSACAEVEFECSLFSQDTVSEWNVVQPHICKCGILCMYRYVPPINSSLKNGTNKTKINSLWKTKGKSRCKRFLSMILVMAVFLHPKDQESIFMGARGSFLACFKLPGLVPARLGSRYKCLLNLNTGLHKEHWAYTVD